MAQQGGTYVPDGSSSRLWSVSTRRPRTTERRAPNLDANAATIPNEQLTETTGADGAPRSGPGQPLIDGDDGQWVVVTDAEDGSDTKTLMEFNLILGWGRWKTKIIDFKVWREEDRRTRR
ncbi:hypothetical protein VTI74DRAFT_9017 [Chaetomium olivicolor]